ncbi:acetyl-CoA carboxylase biotin carboxyl carrier protein [Metabacillus fastidiosus]|uniref:Biotin carboxyl carrier protein of acetyl-CoA carboxylase n=1 Tax=Metabacillus fastidiosus TaxID=1458 RepID=A0ABU6NUQ6_9BACI|nr:acetyl-CoA carboxylase biotin carboxyl carrier protein [Metabacillus fastidiosus]MED4400883.1 acetyl-CoA carboxylase biotin carboxyl carrier protein [Metabacillus fastidiosus]
MLKIQEIRELIKLIDNSTIDKFTYEHDGSKIELRKRTQEAETVVQSVTAAPPAVQERVQQAPAPVQQEEVKAEQKQEDTNLHKITSPMVGTFYSASSPEAGPYVQVGSKVQSQSVVCIVEAMKLFNEIEAEVSGEIVEILVENGQLVEYGQPLFLVKA